MLSPTRQTYDALLLGGGYRHLSLIVRTHRALKNMPPTAAGTAGIADPAAACGVDRRRNDPPPPGAMSKAAVGNPRVVHAVYGRGSIHRAAVHSSAGLGTKITSLRSMRWPSAVK